MPFASGWANNCGTELFTIGWVQCEIEEDTRPGGGSSKIKHRDLLREQVLQEEEEIILLVKQLF